MLDIITSIKHCTQGPDPCSEELKDRKERCKITLICRQYISVYKDQRAIEKLLKSIDMSRKSERQQHSYVPARKA